MLGTGQIFIKFLLLKSWTSATTVSLITTGVKHILLEVNYKADDTNMRFQKNRQLSEIEHYFLSFHFYPASNFPEFQVCLFTEQ